MKIHLKPIGKYLDHIKDFSLDMPTAIKENSWAHSSCKGGLSSPTADENLHKCRTGLCFR